MVPTGLNLRDVAIHPTQPQEDRPAGLAPAPKSRVGLPELNQAPQHLIEHSGERIASAGGLVAIQRKAPNANPPRRHDSRREAIKCDQHAQLAQPSRRLEVADAKACAPTVRGARRQEHKGL